MISESWKAIFKKEKSIFNQMVFFQKQKHSQFKEESLELFFVPFFSALSTSVPTPTSPDMVIDSFEIFLTLNQKGFLKEIEGAKEVAFLLLLQKLNLVLNENLKLTLSYLVNAISKLKPSQDKVFIEKLILLSEHITKLKVLENTLITLCWLFGQAQYRTSALKVILDLPIPLRNLIQSEFQLDNSDLDPSDPNPPFGKFEINETNKIRYKIISGYPLLGGDFFTLPILKKGKDSVFVFANQKHYELFFDKFGDYISPTDEKESESTKGALSPFWKVVVAKKIPEASITSYFQTDSYALVTSNLSYSVFVFYRAPR